MPAEVRIEGLAELLAALDHIDETVAEVVERGVPKLGQAFARAVREEEPRRSGNLRRQTRARSKGKGIERTSTVSIGKKAWYGRLVDQGVQPHWIPKFSRSTGRGRGRSRRFVQLGKSNWALRLRDGRFVQRVMHPGFAGRGFWGRGIQRGHTGADAALQSMADELAQAVADDART